MKVLDLFSGIGAYSLGLERTGGFETVALCEINAFCRSILKQHWPQVETFEDVKALTGDGLRAAGIIPNWIVAGWPCQGNSPAGTGLGMDDPRSGLWSEIRRLAGEIRPEGLLLENSLNLLNINGGSDFGKVLGDLASLGFDAEWHCLSAAAFDAPHIRDRVWIIATRSDAYGQGLAIRASNAGRLGGSGKVVPRRPSERVGHLPDPSRVGRIARGPEPTGVEGRPLADGYDLAPHAYRIAPVGTAIARAERVSWEPEPDVVRVVHGAPDRVERIHALGNLNPPIIPETIGRAVLAALDARAAA